MSEKVQSQRVDHRSTPFTLIYTALVILAYLSLSACQQQSDLEMEKSSIDSSISPRTGSASVLLLDSLLRRWVLVTVHGSPVVVDDDGEHEAWIEFGPPCYETGDGHCNEAFDGGWEPSEQRRGRLSLRGFSGCNWFGSEAILEGEHLVAKLVISTERGCGNAGSQEARIQKLLSEKPSLFIQDDKLEIANVMGDRIVAVLSLP